MATKYDMPTNEGTLALARAVTSGAKLVIREARLCKVTSSSLMGKVSDAAALTWSSLSSYAISSGTMPCTSYLPSLVDYLGEETNSPIAALDLEFTYMPSTEVSYNVIAVLADMYYAISPFKSGTAYNVGDVVWCIDNAGVYTYYKCTSAVSNSTYPGSDTSHWQSVTISKTLSDKYMGIQYSTISTTPILLYVSKSSGVITLSPQMEIDYKVRLYLDGVHNTERIKEFVVFNTLGLELSASTELNLLAEFSNQLNRVRDVAMAKASRS